jgi:hypothetical protein
MGLTEAMDAFVKRSGLYRMALIERPEPRSLRWIPLLVLLVIATGYAILVSAPEQGRDAGLRLFLGASLVVVGDLMAFYLRFLGPRLMPDPRHPLDEREQAIRARSGFISGSTISFLAMGGCFYLGLAPLLGLGVPDSPLEWIFLGFALEGIYFLLPVLVASWLQRPLSEDD